MNSIEKYLYERLESLSGQMERNFQNLMFILKQSTWCNSITQIVVYR